MEQTEQYQRTPGFAELRERILDERLFGRVRLPQAEEVQKIGSGRCKIPLETYPRVLEEVETWVDDVVGSAQGPLKGLHYESIPPEVFELMRWSSMPISMEGPLEWGTDVQVGDIDKPSVEGDCLMLPTSERLATMTSLSIRPLRHYIGTRLGLRLQAATGIGMYIWDNQALLTCRSLVPVGGFLHGPTRGRRTTLSMDPGGYQLIKWD